MLKQQRHQKSINGTLPSRQVISNIWPQEEIPPQNRLDTSKSLTSANGRKSGNNPPLKLNKDNVK